MEYTMNEDHEPGRCGACHKETDVRWKNLYTIGSEGTWLCLPCELIVVNLIRDMSRTAFLKQKEEYKRKRALKQAQKTAGGKSWWIEKEV
jgi:hypothetical protein